MLNPCLPPVIIMDVHLTFSRGLHMVHMVISYIGCVCSLFFQLLPLFEIGEGIKLQELCACVYWELQYCKVCINILHRQMH